MTAIRCENCAFNDKGTCKRYPPNLYQSHKTRPEQPTIQDYDWCGEFKSKEQYIPAMMLVENDNVAYAQKTIGTFQ